MPAQLKELMRHESIKTTLRFYVGTDAQAKADAAWAAFEASRPKNVEASGNSLAHSAPSSPPLPAAATCRKPKRRLVVIPNRLKQVRLLGLEPIDQRIKSPDEPEG